MKIIKLFLIVSILFTLSTVCAVGVDDFKIPKDYSMESSSGNYFIPKAYDNPTFTVSRYVESEKIFENDSGYTVWQIKDKYIFNTWSLKTKSSIGAVELIEKDNQKFVISSQYASTVKDDDYLNQAVEYLEEFNELNNITPIKPR